MGWEQEKWHPVFLGSYLWPQCYMVMATFLLPQTTITFISIIFSLLGELPFSSNSFSPNHDGIIGLPTILFNTRVAHQQQIIATFPNLQQCLDINDMITTEYYFNFLTFKRNLFLPQVWIEEYKTVYRPHIFSHIMCK